ncbi:MAG: SDR family oxidoreductase [Saprospiraceae bacterium]|nr:SDR family oxidoreductase [Saprospiraceae bacterium]
MENKEKTWKYRFSEEEWDACLRVLDMVMKHPERVPELGRFKNAISDIAKKYRKQKQAKRVQVRTEPEYQVQPKKEKIPKIHNNRYLQEKTGIVKGRRVEKDDFLAEKLDKPIECYACQDTYRKVHHFYHRLCPKCALYNYEQRKKRADLKGRVVLITGARIKIGYHTAIQLLRDGARVIATTRFPVSAALNYEREPDFEEWKDRLTIYGLDFRDIQLVERFTKHLKHELEALDIIINNAAQTIKYPAAFFSKELQQEQESKYLNPNIQSILAENRAEYQVSLPKMQTELQHKPVSAHFPQGKRDRFGQQVDLRPVNSWVLNLDEVSTTEFLEVQLINTTAPFILNSRLRSLMKKSSFPQRFIINVTSSEGQFSYPGKKVTHPHTNMSKAALNMMTRTSASDYVRDQIYMNSVDVGWVSSGNPPQIEEKRIARGFFPPLDLQDATARIYAPILDGIRGELHFGKLYKNYKVIDW